MKLIQYTGICTNWSTMRVEYWFESELFGWVTINAWTQATKETRREMAGYIMRSRFPYSQDVD